MKDLLYLAPLRGVTDVIFRSAFERFFGSFDFLLAPFIPSTKGNEVKPAHVRDIVGEENDRRQLIPQIIGNNPRDFVVMASFIAAEGYLSVNWNLGCPHQQITRKRRGCGLMPFPEDVERFLDTVIPKLTIPLSIKVRLGLEDTREIDLLVPIFNRYPLSEVIIHSRTGKQQYNGVVDLERFNEVSQRIRHPIVFNGDIGSLERYHYCKDQCPEVDRWMIGRGVAHNPFLLSELRTGKRCFIDYSLLQQFHQEVFQRNRERLFGPAHLLGKMKEFWWYLIAVFPEQKKWLKKIQRTTSVTAYEAHVENMFSCCKS